MISWAISWALSLFRRKDKGYFARRVKEGKQMYSFSQYSSFQRAFYTACTYVLVHLGYCNGRAQVGSLLNNRLIFTLLEVESSREGAGRFEVW